MFDLQIPWWEILVRVTTIYVVLLVLVRVSGHRTIGQFTPFDLLVVLLLAETVSPALSGGDDSVTGGLIGAATLIALNLGVAMLTSGSKKMALLIDGHPVLIGRDGEFFADVARKCRLAEADLEEALREHDCERKDMEFAFLEIDGQIAILKKKNKKE